MVCFNFRNHKSESSASFKKIGAKVDTRWPNGLPVSRKAVKGRLIRRQTEHDYKSQMAISTENEEDIFDDDVFNNISNVKNSTPFNHSTSSTESVSNHYNRLFDKLDAYMETAPEFDCIFIRRRVEQMKDEMFAINEMFKDLLVTGRRMEKFLLDRQNNSNFSKNSS